MAKRVSRRQRIMRNRIIAGSVLVGFIILIILLIVFLRKDPVREVHKNTVSVTSVPAKWEEMEPEDVIEKDVPEEKTKEKPEESEKKSEGSVRTVQKIRPEREDVMYEGDEDDIYLPEPVREPETPPSVPLYGSLDGSDETEAEQEDDTSRSDSYRYERENTSYNSYNNNSYESEPTEDFDFGSFEGFNN